MSYRTVNFVPWWGTGLVLGTSVLLAALLTASVGREGASMPAAAAVEALPDFPTMKVEAEFDPLGEARQALRPAALTADIKVYHGKEYRFVKSLKLRVTAYAPDPRCTYPYDGKTTASGLPVTTNGGRLVASDPAVIPMHWVVAVPGYAGGRGVPVLDRGGAIKGNRLDVLLPTFEEAKEWGVKMLEVRIYRPVEGDG
jgi:3D (Asp-Asp-Asp) domain-containing protein